MRDVLSDGIRRVGGGEGGARLSGCVWLEVIQRSRRGGRPPLPCQMKCTPRRGRGGTGSRGPWPCSPEATAASCHCRYNFFISKDDKSFGPDSHSRAYTAESFLIPFYCSDKAGLIPSQYIFLCHMMNVSF